MYPGCSLYLCVAASALWVISVSSLSPFPSSGVLDLRRNGALRGGQKPKAISMIAARCTAHVSRFIVRERSGVRGIPLG